MEELRRKRKARGWSQAELARRARLHPSDISRFESGRAIPYPIQLQKLAQALGVAESALLGDDLTATCHGKELS